MNGTMIAESLRVGATLDDLGIVVRQVRRFRVQNAPEYQPAVWTTMEFEAADEDAEKLAKTLEASLDEPGWYVNYSTATETFVVFPGKVFRYPRGDQEGRATAQAHGLGLGVPEAQLDWSE